MLHQERYVSGALAQVCFVAVEACLRAPWITLALALVCAIGTFGLYRSLPQEITPDEDRGTIFAVASTPVGASLAYTDEQVRKIREIFEKREAEVKPVWDQLNREGDRLDKMTRERLADEATYAVQVSKVHHLFADVRKSRTMMLYRMYRELQPEQYKKLQEIMERRRSTDGRSSGPSGPR